MALLAEEGLAGKRVLDIGCGWGRLALLLAPARAHVVGLDRDDGDPRASLLESSAGAHDRPGGPDPGHEVGQPISQRGQDLILPRFHTLGFAFFLVVVSQHVQQPMDQQM